MKYLIESVKWSKHNGYITWWRPNEKGYTKYIAEAGIYTEQEAIKVQNRCGEKVAIAVQIDEDILKRGISQLEEQIEISECSKKRHEQYARECEDNIAKEKLEIIELTKKFRC